MKTRSTRAIGLRMRSLAIPASKSLHSRNSASTPWNSENTMNRCTENLEKRPNMSRKAKTSSKISSISTTPSTCNSKTQRPPKTLSQKYKIEMKSGTCGSLVEM